MDAPQPWKRVEPSGSQDAGGQSPKNIKGKDTAHSDRDREVTQGKPKNEPPNVPEVPPQKPSAKDLKRASLTKQKPVEEGRTPAEYLAIIQGNTPKKGSSDVYQMWNFASKPDGDKDASKASSRQPGVHRAKGGEPAQVKSQPNRREEKQPSEVKSAPSKAKEPVKAGKNVEYVSLSDEHTDIAFTNCNNLLDNIGKLDEILQKIHPAQVKIPKSKQQDQTNFSLKFTYFDKEILNIRDLVNQIGRDIENGKNKHSPEELDKLFTHLQTRFDLLNERIGEAYTDLKDKKYI
jgi:hypothetical protein